MTTLPPDAEGSDHPGGDPLAHFVAVTSGDATAREKRAFAQWAEADDSRRQEVEEYRRLAAEVEALRPVYAAEIKQLKRRAPRTRPWLWAAATAGIVAIVLVGTATASRTVTAEGGRPVSVGMADGSRIDLDAGASVDFSYLPWLRHARLRAGAAVFDVVHDDSHPFSVQVGGAVVKDVGTRFLARADSTGAMVAVFAGAVDIGGQEVSAGQAILADKGGGLKPLPMPDEEQATAWRHGRLVFNNTTLAMVAEQLSRYQPDAPVIAAPAVAAMRLSGSFDLDNRDGILRTLQVALPVSVRRTATGVLLVPTVRRN